jgi:hypothetical protein
MEVGRSFFLVERMGYSWNKSGFKGICNLPALQVNIAICSSVRCAYWRHVVDDSKARNFLAVGPIPCYWIGRAVRFEPADLDAYLKSRRCEPFDSVKEAGQARLSVVHLKASDPEGGRKDFFRRRGLVLKKAAGRKNG